MEKLIWTIIGLAIYFGGGWITKDIFFSVIEITEKTTLGDITLYECYIYSAIAGLFSLIASCYGQHNKEDSEIKILIVIPIAIGLVLIKRLPLSMGLIALYNIINIGCIIMAVYTNEKIN